MFTLPSTVKTQWFRVSSSGNWMVLFRESDEFLALIQLDLNASDYRTAVASQEGKLIMPTGLPKAHVMDFDEESGTIRYIDLGQRYHQAKVKRIGSNPLQLSVEEENDEISIEWKTALELDS